MRKANNYLFLHPHHRSSTETRARRKRHRADVEALEPRTLLSIGGGSTAAGFLGEYFDNPDLSGSPAFTRGDVRIDFDWDGRLGPGGSRSSDFAALDPTGFSVRWTGQVVPRFSEPYTFTTTTAGGVRLSVKPAGSSTWTVLVDDWSAHQTITVQVVVDRSNCSFQFNPTGTAKFTSSCDIAKQVLANNSVNYESIDGSGVAQIKVGDKVWPTMEVHSVVERFGALFGPGRFDDAHDISAVVPEEVIGKQRQESQWIIGVDAGQHRLRQFTHGVRVGLVGEFIALEEWLALHRAVRRRQRVATDFRDPLEIGLIAGAALRRNVGDLIDRIQVGLALGEGGGPADPGRQPEDEYQRQHDSSDAHGPSSFADSPAIMR